MQLQVKHFFDKKASPKKFEVGGMVLMWNARTQDNLESMENLRHCGLDLIAYPTHMGKIHTFSKF